MTEQTTLTERQLELITKAETDHGGLIEPLLDLKGGAKVKMIGALSRRGLIQKQDNLWRTSALAQSIVRGDAPAIAPADKQAPDCEPTKMRRHSKQSMVVDMLSRPEGATIEQIVERTGWQAHTVRGVFAGALKKKLGLTIASEKTSGPGGAQRIYRIAQGAQAGVPK